MIGSPGQGWSDAQPSGGKSDPLGWATPGGPGRGALLIELRKFDLIDTVGNLPRNNDAMFVQSHDQRGSTDLALLPDTP
jgi:hypothetical protein